MLGLWKTTLCGALCAALLCGCTGSEDVSQEQSPDSTVRRSSDSMQAFDLQTSPPQSMAGDGMESITKPETVAFAEEEPVPLASASEMDESPVPQMQNRAAVPEQSPDAMFSAVDDIPAAGALSESEVEQKLLALINQERAAAGTAPLGMEDSMRRAARLRAPEVIVSLTHTRPDGSLYTTAFDEAGYAYHGKSHGENVSWIYFTAGMYDSDAVAQRMFEALRASPGHYRNMVSADYSLAGIGVRVQTNGDITEVGSAQLFSGV